MGTSFRKHAAVVLGVGLAYVAAGKLGLSFALDNPIVSPVWPPTGVAIGAALLWGRLAFPAIAVGAFVVNVTTSHHVPASLAIAAGNVTEAWLGATLVRRFAGGRNAFVDPQTILAFAGLAAALATAVSASIGVAALVTTGLAQASDAGQVWLTWWLGDASGALLFAPLVVLWAQPIRGARTPWHRVVELVALVLMLVCIAAPVFVGLLPAGLGYVGGSLLVWMAFRFGQRTTAAATLIWSAIAIAGTMRGHGPFARASLNESLLLLQTYMGVLALTSLTVSAAIKQRTRLAASLETQVRERTSELAAANAQLQHALAEREALERQRERFLEERAARHEAERMNRQKDEFLATLSHELRTPLGAVLGWAELLQRGPADDGTRERALDTIVRNARLQVRLISDMLDVSRIIAGKLDLNVQPMDAAAVVAGAVEQQRPEADRKSLRLSWTASAATGPVLGDPERFGQAVANVIGNAVKFTPEGGAVDVTLVERDGLEITVADTGPGIPPEFMPALFDRFTQLDRSRTRRHGGLGLGLSIARHIVELHGGTIAAANRPEGGARFTIQVPVMTGGARVPAPAVPRGDEAAADIRADVLAGALVLVVDDDAGAREITAAILERCGARVRTAASADHGVRALEAEAADALVVDLAMPEVDGYAFLARARALFPRLPALALTAHAAPVEERRARVAGFDAFLSKPVDPAVLARAVTDLLDPRTG